MTFIFILIITVIITWFLVDKKEHQSNLKKVGGLRVKYKELLNFLVSKSNDDVKLIDKGVELYVSFSISSQAYTYSLTEGFNLLLVKLTINTPNRELKHKWEFNTKTYTQQRMISSINTYLNGIIKNLDEYNDRNVPKKNLNKSENTDSTETKNTEIKSSIESNVLSTKNFFCEKCTSLFRVDLGFNHNKKNDYRLDFMPIGNERFKDNFVKCLLESDCVCPHSINILDKTSIGNMNIYNVISFDNFLKRKASELGYNSDLDKSHKQASLYYLYASWFTNNKSKSENYLDLASSENMIYNLSLMSTNKTIENRDVLYDLIFLDVQRKQGENFDYCVSMAKLTYKNILSTDIDDDTQFHTMDIPNLIKIIEAQINLASKGDTKDYTLSKIGVNYIDCFTMIGRFLQQKI